MDRRLTPEIEESLATIIRETPILDGFAIGGGIAKGYGGDDVDADLLISSRKARDEAVEQAGGPSKYYQLFVERFAELYAHEPLHVRMPIPRTTVQEHGYRPTTIYVLRNQQIAEIWGVDLQKTEVHFAEKT